MLDTKFFISFVQLSIYKLVILLNLYQPFSWTPCPKDIIQVMVVM